MPNRSGKLIFIKIIHTLIWIFFVSVIFYIVYSGVTNQVNILTWVCIGLVFLEGAVLLIFRMACPLTLVARKFSDSQRDNFDIYLPNWLAKYNKVIFTSIFAIGVLLVVYRTIKAGA
jgi:hypothetical protein